MIHRAASNIRKGRPLVIFPEGTRNFGGPLGDFKAGSFKAAKLAGGWIVPVTLDGSWRFMQIPRRVLPGRLRIVIHQAIDASALDVQGWKELPGRVREAIAGSILLTPEREGFKPRASKHRIAVG
jgi:1-acyl-sn-glycerol-3-phosphate acyltransferase